MASSCCAAVAAVVSNGMALTLTTSPRLGSTPAAAATRERIWLCGTLVTDWSSSTATDIRRTAPGAAVVLVFTVPRALERSLEDFT